MTYLTTLLVIVPDRISDIISKGEFSARYYNPGELFDEVHILLVNDDHVDKIALQKTVGRAALSLHNLPIPSFISTFGWQPFLLHKWVETGIQLVREIQPDLIRVHGSAYNGFLAAQIKKQLHIPVVVSLHTYPDVIIKEQTGLWSNLKNYIYNCRIKQFENETLKNADWVCPVYESIRAYARLHGAQKITVCYNVLNPDYLYQKESYSLHSPVRIIFVGRLIPGKNPENIIRAVARFPDIELTIVGDGVLYDYLQQVSGENLDPGRVIFYKAIQNDTLCRMLPEYDIFAVCSDYLEISKTVLEALLTGLPVVINKRQGDPVPELKDDFVCLVKNTPEGYYNAFEKLLQDHTFREQLGRTAYAHAQEFWSPEKTEAAYVKIYQQVLSEYKK